ncbi:hypothetical protein GCM10025774_28360 [Microbacterium kyungheense]
MIRLSKSPLHDEVVMDVTHESLLGRTFGHGLKPRRQVLGLLELSRKASPRGSNESPECPKSRGENHRSCRNKRDDQFRIQSTPLSPEHGNVQRS